MPRPVLLSENGNATMELPSFLWPVTHLRLICARLLDPFRLSVEGSIVRHCWNCGEKVMVSPASFAAARKDAKKGNFVGFHIICLECSILFARQDELLGKGKPIHLPPSKEQLLEQPCDRRIMVFLNN